MLHGGAMIAKQVLLLVCVGDRRWRSGGHRCLLFSFDIQHRERVTCSKPGPVCLAEHQSNDGITSQRLWYCCTPAHIHQHTCTTTQKSARKRCHFNCQIKTPPPRRMSQALGFILRFNLRCPGANNKASPPGRHQEQVPKQRCTFRPTAFSSVHA